MLGASLGCHLDPDRQPDAGTAAACRLEASSPGDTGVVPEDAREISDVGDVGDAVVAGGTRDAGGAGDAALMEWTQPCGDSSEGKCRLGTMTCDPVARRCGSCFGAIYPQLEICDGIDNDCDGETDKIHGVSVCGDGGPPDLPPPPDCGQPFSVACGFSKIGTCRLGQMKCHPESSTCDPCMGAVYPTAEICDSLDNDCDGTPDNGIVCPPPPCPASPAFTVSCGASNIGACRRGTSTCDPATATCTACVGAVYPQVETANNVDDDCDGQPDNVVCPSGTIPCGQSDVGECRMGTATYYPASAAWGACQGAVYATPEILDGKDNDCDGNVDDVPGPPGSTFVVPCGTSGVGECRMGTMTCDPSIGTCTPCGGAVYPKSEVCNGEDDDCNGVADDSLACNDAGPDVEPPPACDPITVTCGDSATGECKMGTSVCDPCAGTCGPCVGAVFPGTEVCNGKDDDCDGGVDEAFPDLGQSCTVGLGECQRTGKKVCAPNGLGTVCDAAPGTPAPKDDCNGEDDDCDGLVDYSIVAGVPKNQCQCEPPLLPGQTVAQDSQQNNCLATTCNLTSSAGSCAPGWSMSYCLNACLPPYPYAQCRFGTFSLNQFDADNGGQGTLEVKFCLDQQIHGGLNLWYGEYPQRKSLLLLNDAERVNGLGPGCFTRYFKPQSARCSQIPLGETVPSPGLPDACRKQNWICPDGKWTQLGSQCKFDYDNVPIYVTAEQCVTGGAVQATVTGIAVRYYPGECECQSNANCQGGSRSVCNPASYHYYVSEADRFHVSSVNLCMLPE